MLFLYCTTEKLRKFVKYYTAYSETIIIKNVLEFKFFSNSFQIC